MIEQLTALFDELNVRYFRGTLPRVPIGISNCKSKYGWYHHRGLIEIAKFHLETNPFRSSGNRDSVEETLLHEMIHHELWTKYKYHGHGKLFQLRSNECGITVFGKGSMPTGKLLYRCPQCKAEWRRHRRWPSRRFCLKCKVDIELVQAA